MTPLGFTRHPSGSQQPKGWSSQDDGRKGLSYSFSRFAVEKHPLPG